MVLVLYHLDLYLKGLDGMENIADSDPTFWSIFTVFPNLSFPVLWVVMVVVPFGPLVCRAVPIQKWSFFLKILPYAFLEFI